MKANAKKLKQKKIEEKITCPNGNKNQGQLIAPTQQPQKLRGRAPWCKPAPRPRGKQNCACEERRIPTFRMAKPVWLLENK